MFESILNAARALKSKKKLLNPSTNAGELKFLGSVNSCPRLCGFARPARAPAER